MTPLQVKISAALKADIQEQIGTGFEMDYDRLAQVVYDTIRDAMAEALRGVAEARRRREAEVNAAIDEVTK